MRKIRFDRGKNAEVNLETTGNPAAGRLPKGLFDKDAGQQSYEDAVLLNEGLFQGSVESNSASGK